MLNKRIEDAFADCFSETFNTVLVGGAEEPFYRVGDPHRIEYRADYVRSALHEIAHWCVAGADRRAQDDYGYWYSADGRNAQQQAAFEQAEILPQAIEAEFCAALRIPFAPSLDNLNGESSDPAPFARAIEAKRPIAACLNDRVIRFRSALAEIPT